MYSFEYQRPTSVAQAVATLRAQSDAKPLAGGQSLVQAMKLRLARSSHLVDLGGIAELRKIAVSGTEVTIGAMTTHAAVAASADVKKAIKGLAALAGGIGDRQVRNRGTIGGSLANNDPAACYPSAVLALGATIKTTERSIAADDFFKGLYETALKPGELITEVSFPIPQAAAYMKFNNPASRFALVGVFVARFANGVRVAVTGAGSCVFRVPAMEAALTKQFSPDAIANIHVDASNLNSDLHASAEYRAHLITVMAQRAVMAA